MGLFTISKKRIEAYSNADTTVSIFVRDAKALCPHLIIFPYNFEAYEEVSWMFDFNCCLIAG